MLEDSDAAYDEAINQGDAAGRAAFFAEDVILLAPGQPMTRGKRAFEEIYQSRMDSGGTHSNGQQPAQDEEIRLFIFVPLGFTFLAVIELAYLCVHWKKG